MSPQNQLNIYFVTSTQYCLGIANLKKVFRPFLIHSKKLPQNLKNFAATLVKLIKFVSHFCVISQIFQWLTHPLMSSDKCNSITGETTGFIFALSDVALSWDVPFRQLQQFHCLHHSSTKAYLCSPFLSPLPHWWQFTIHLLWLQCKGRVRTVSKYLLYFAKQDWYTLLEQSVGLSNWLFY